MSTLNAALIVAAGRGRRLGGPVPKQYRSLGGHTVLRHTLLAFLRHPGIGLVQTVIHQDDLARYRAATAGLDLPDPVLGGATRQETVRLGLRGLARQEPAKVVIHDAVRPFVTARTLDAVLEALDRGPAVITGVSVPDTLKRCRDGLIVETIDRTGVWRAQTPQGFRFEAILAAHEAAHAEAGPDLTDDAIVIERSGVAVSMLEGSEDNFKITTELDLERAQRLVK